MLTSDEVRRIAANIAKLPELFRTAVSKRLGSSYRAGRSKYWVKVKNPEAPAVKREAEEDWGSPRWIKQRKQTAVTRGEY